MLGATMARCKAKKKNGERCPNAAGASGFCFTHDPARGAERAKARRRGGAARLVPHGGDPANLPAAVRSVADVQAVLDYTLRELVPHDNGIQRARALVSLSLACLKALEVGELEARLEQIEAALGLGQQKAANAQGQTTSAT